MDSLIVVVTIDTDKDTADDIIVDIIGSLLNINPSYDMQIIISKLGHLKRKVKKGKITPFFNLPLYHH